MPSGEDGTSLAEHLIPLLPQALTNAAATFVDSLKISSTSEKRRRGRRVVIKRRNIYGEGKQAPGIKVTVKSCADGILRVFVESPAREKWF